jgi:hypothetical protein
MLLESGCSPAIRRQAIEALAIHHEHRRRDLASARWFAERHLEMTRHEREALKTAARRRLTRVERKLQESRGLLE